MNVLSQPRLDRLSALMSRFTLTVDVEYCGTLNEELIVEPGDCGSFHVLRSGVAILDRRQTILAPSLVLAPQGKAHALSAVVGETVQLISGRMDFGPADLNPVVAALPDIAVIPLAAALEPTLTLLEAEAFAPRCGAQAVINRTCEILLIQALRHLIAAQSVQSGVLAGLADPKLARALTAMHDDPARAWTLQSAAAEAGMSRTSFAVGFHRRIGMTMGDYLGWWRASLAKRLLEQGVTLQNAAGQVGYESPAALARQMRKVLGAGPREIQKAARHHDDDAD
jgi:AraC-like DNA-binding protein